MYGIYNVPFRNGATAPLCLIFCWWWQRFGASVVWGIRTCHTVDTVSKSLSVFFPSNIHQNEKPDWSWWTSLMSVMVGLPCTIYSFSCFFFPQSFYDKGYSIFRGRKEDFIMMSLFWFCGETFRPRPVQDRHHAWQHKTKWRGISENYQNYLKSHKRRSCSVLSKQDLDI